MGLDYSYTQPSEDEDIFGHSFDSGDSEIEDLIRRDQAELSLQASKQVYYPPQPEVEFGFPPVCYCGAQPVLSTSKTGNYAGRLLYTCANVDDGDCHVWKWWDVAVMEEMRDRDRHVLQLAQKVDGLTSFRDDETEHKLASLEKKVCDLTSFRDDETEQKMASLEKMVCDLGKEKIDFSNRFEYFVCGLVLVLVLVGVVLVFV